MTNDGPMTTANPTPSNVGPLRPPVNFEDDEYTWPPGELHWPGCWAAGPQHYRCALAEVNRLRQTEDELRALLNRETR